MDKKFDDALRHALAPSDEAEYCLNQKILNRVGEKSVMVEREKRRVSVAIIITALLLCMSSATVYAAWKHLSSSDVAENIQDIKLSEVFLSEQALTINETQSYGVSAKVFRRGSGGNAGG